MYYLTSFIVGFVIMTVELTASRVIAPTLGSSLYTWTGVIGVVLFGVALGNYLGGTFADKMPPKSILSKTLLLSALFVALVPSLNQILPSLLPFHLGLIPNIAALVIALFFVPAALLGTVFPVLVKITADTLSTIGARAGKLSAFGAAGSIAGTFLTGFVFIGALGSSLTLWLCALTLLALSFFTGAKTHNMVSLATFPLLLLPLALMNASARQTHQQVIFAKESNYYSIKTIDRLGIRWLFLDADLHSAEYQSGGRAVVPYIKALTLSKLFFGANNQEEPKNILIIGGGSYSLAKQFTELFPSSAIEVVEIDSQVTKTAERYFNLKRFPILTVNEDARWFLQRADKTYDIIIGDAYNSFISVPWQLTTKEFAELVKTRLSPGGVYMVNFASQTQGNGSAFFKAFSYTLLNVFPHVYGLPLQGIETSEPQNIILIAFRAKPDTLSASSKPLATGLEPEALALGKNLFNVAGLEFANVKTLTDDWAPVEKMMLPTVTRYFPQYLEFLKQNGLSR